MVESFVAQLAGLPAVLEALSYHRAVPLAVLATEVGLPERKVRELLVSYFMTDEPVDQRGWVPPLEFLDEQGQEVEPSSAPLVRLTSDIVTNDLAFRYSPVATWARTYRIARDQLHLDPENSRLEGALEKLGRSIDDEMRPSSAIDRRPDGPAAWYRAARNQQRVSIRYARSWRPGVTERVVEPYRVLRTRRGWEVDAGPPDENGRLRTYLVSGVVKARFLDESFELPDGLAEMLARQRATTPVEFVLPPEEVWVVERLAERVEEIGRDDDDVSIRAYFLEPVRERVAEALVTAGPRAMVVDKDLMDAGRARAAALLEHHRRRTSAAR
ncbi:WYL domain-containing protein [Phycicoccus duodecadis]|uniref:Proteasome accessory factor C n=1 Tax=Phycicoccus duodecadis TaxID=173053 RepID=A0A2N3YFT9_9MICO|nr:WYL domain-containing protein [Phycicoccus duodecadis]PKW25724.1 proteasome accessory factor C [Phycicoccus duodecadis]